MIRRSKHVDTSDRPGAVLAALAILISPALLPTTVQATNTPSILVLHSYHAQMRWTIEQQRGISQVFEEASPPVNYFIEYLDAKRFPAIPSNAEFLAHLKIKYAANRFGAAVVTDASALRFLLDHRDVLGISSVFFTGINPREYPDFAEAANITGLVESLEVGKTIELATRIQPETRRVFVIHDTSDSGQANREMVEEAAIQWTGRLEFVYPGPFTFEELFDRLRNLPRGTVVLNMGVSHDRAGRPMRQHLREQLNRVSSVPIYATSEDSFTDIGVAGSLLSGREHGERAARMALRHLADPGRPLPPVDFTPPQKLVADYERMQRFGLDPALLPPGTDLRNQPESFLVSYRWQIYTAASLILVLAIAVVLLTGNIRERRRSEAAVRRTEALYRNAIAAANAVPYMRDLAQGTYSFIGPGIHALTGYPPGEMTPDLWDKLTRKITFHGTNASLPVGQVLQGIRKGEIVTWSADLLIESRDKQQKWVADVAIGERIPGSDSLRSIGILFDITDRKQAELRLGAMTELGQQLSTATCLESAARIIVETARRTLGWDACSIDLYDETRAVITPVLNIDTIDGNVVDVPPAYVGINDDSIVHRVIKSGAVRVLRSNDSAQAPALKPFGDTSRRSASLMFVPVRENRRTIGVLSIQSYTPFLYGEVELNTLQSLADLCGGAFERIRAQGQIEKLNAELEQRVVDRTAQLASAIGELESFSYSVSHDLRAPLRHISGFATFVEQRPGLQGDEVAQRHLRTIIQSARRLGQLIDDLLVFARISREALSIAPVETGPLVEAILKELAPELSGRTIVWKISALPQVQGNAAMIKLALHNLIANAVKYTSKKDKAIIAISGVEAPGETILSITDNGAGFDMLYAQKLFGVFQRLHRDEEFEGTGIGLASVKRIVERHGGRIWGEGEVGVGATFSIALPRDPHRAIQPIVTPQSVQSDPGAGASDDKSP